MRILSSHYFVLAEKITLAGHVFAGATLPFGMAKAVADTIGENQAGFASDTSLVTGFSHMHDSGTGGVRWPRHPNRVSANPNPVTIPGEFPNLRSAKLSER